MSTKSSTPSAERGSARERLLAAANELFYEEGVHTVGIDRVIERAGVAKASLYNTFGSKEELVREYLAIRHDARVDRMTRGLAHYESPREKLLGVYDVLGEITSQPTFRGCAFVNARSESASSDKVTQICDISRAWTRSLFTDLARDAGVAEPGSGSPRNCTCSTTAQPLRRAWRIGTSHPPQPHQRGCGRWRLLGRRARPLTVEGC